MNPQKRKIGILIIVLLSIIGIVAPIVIAYLNRPPQPKCSEEGEPCNTEKGCCPDAPICNQATGKCSVKPSEKYILTPGVCEGAVEVDPVNSLTGPVSYTDADKLVNDAGLKCDADGDCPGFLTFDGFAYKCSKPIKILEKNPSSLKGSKTYINQRQI